MSSNLHNIFDNPSPALATGMASHEAAELPEELCSLVDTALHECFGQTYAHDALLGEALTQIRGTLDSAQKRHGKMLEAGIAFCFARQETRFEVLTQVPVILSRESIALINANPIKTLEKLNVPMTGTRGKRIIVDIVAFDHETGVLNIISVKRGNGAQGGTAARDARTDLSAAGLMLRQIMLHDGFPVQSVRKILVDWYGRSGITAREKVSRDTVDDYFGIPIAAFVDAMSDRFAAGIAERVFPYLSKAVAGLQDDQSDEASADQTVTDPADEALARPGVPSAVAGAAKRPSLGECLSVLPQRPQGRQMRQVRA